MKINERMAIGSVDPANLPPVMSKEELEWWIIFSICVAGKSAKQTAAKVNAMLNSITVPNFWGNISGASYRRLNSPMAKLSWVAETRGALRKLLKQFKIGQYGRIGKALRQAIHLNLERLTLQALEAIPGVGPKTARMVMMYGVEGHNSKYAVLDTHILKWMRSRGYSAPKSTPTGAKYRELEQQFLALAVLMGKTPKELDTEIWLQYAKK